MPLGAAIRIVKGAYLEPADVAFPKKSDVDANYFKLCTRLLAPDARKPGALLHIATHDIALADRLAAHIAQHNVPASAYEFAMLYGIQRGQQAAARARGQPLARPHQLRRVLVPVVHAPPWRSGRRTCGSSCARCSGDFAAMFNELIAVVAAKGGWTF